jgi:acyl-CoA thioesterase FadM
VEITISYLAPVPTKEEISVEGWITRDRGRVVECESVVTCKSKPLARGRGKFIDMGSDKLREAKPGIKFDRAPSFKDFFLTRES